jgi:hypothetical protein
MPYMFHLQPQPGPSLTIEDYMARFLAIGFEPMPGRPCVKRLNYGGIVAFKIDDVTGVPYACAGIGLVTLGWDAEDIRPRVEAWIHVAGQTDSLIFDGTTMDLLADEDSIMSCIERVVVKRRACFRSTAWIPRSDII